MGARMKSFWSDIPLQKDFLLATPCLELRLTIRCFVNYIGGYPVSASPHARPSSLPHEYYWHRITAKCVEVCPGKARDADNAVSALIALITSAICTV
jgi:hypothetical protein